MTGPDIIEELTELKDETKTVQNRYDPHQFQYKKCENYINAINEAVRTLKHKSEADEYRTPRKIENKSSVKCPKCNYELADSKQSVIYMSPFCPNCGQALDWSEMEE